MPWLQLVPRDNYTYASYRELVRDLVQAYTATERYPSAFKVVVQAQQCLQQAQRQQAPSDDSMALWLMTKVGLLNDMKRIPSTADVEHWHPALRKPAQVGGDDLVPQGCRAAAAAPPGHAGGVPFASDDRACAGDRHGAVGSTGFYDDIYCASGCNAASEGFTLKACHQAVWSRRLLGPAGMPLAYTKAAEQDSVLPHRSVSCSASAKSSLR